MGREGGTGLCVRAIPRDCRNSRASYLSLHCVDSCREETRAARSVSLANEVGAHTDKQLRVVLAALYWDYGQKERGLSYEYYNLYLCLKEMYQVQFFDYYGLLLEKGRDQMNRELLALIKQERPDLAIIALFQEEFIPEIIEELKQYTRTLGYFFSDDTWRIEFTKRWAPRFHYVTTSSTNCLRRYKEWGYDHASFSPLGYNHSIFRKKDLQKLYDVSFIGGF